MRKILLLLLVSVFSFLQVGCKKDDETLSVEKTYKVSVYNVKNNGNYRFRFLQGDKILKEYVIAPGEGIDFSISKGDYSWEAVQISGYVLYPTRYGSSITVDRDREIKF